MALRQQVDRTSDTFLMDCYTGKGGFLTGQYLIPHLREDTDTLNERAAYSVYTNYVADVVQTYSGYLWKKSPSRETGDGYAAFSANADGLGNSLDYVMQNQQLLAMVLGTVWLIVDRAPVLPQNKAQQPLPYIAMRMPTQVVSYSIDGLGQLNSITFREVVQEGDISPWFGLSVIQSMMAMIGKQQFRHYDRQGWKISLDQAGRLPIAQGEHKLGRVPVVRLNSTVPLLPTQQRADPCAFGTCQLNWNLYNLESEKRTLFRKQTFSILTIPVKDSQEAEQLKNMTIGTDNALTYNPEGGGKPAYIAPADGPITQYMNDIEKAVVAIYKSANLEFISGVASSGTALSFQFQKANARMGVVAGQCEGAEREIAQIVAAWNGEQTGHIAYSRDFNLTDLATDLKTAMDAKTMDISETFNKELDKRTARQVLGHGVTAAVMNTIDGEIEAGGDPYGDRLAQEAGNGIVPTLPRGNVKSGESTTQPVPTPERGNHQTTED